MHSGWALWQAHPESLPPLLALIATVVTALVGRRVQKPWLASLAPFVGLVAGWLIRPGLDWPPRGIAQHLAWLSVPLGALACSVGTAARTQTTAAVVALLALGAGWWLAGAPLGLHALEAEAARIGIAAVIVAGAALLCARLDAWQQAAVAAALWAALHAVRVGLPGPTLAAVVAAAAIGALFVQGGMRAGMGPALGAATGGAAAAAVLADGRLPRGRIDAVTIAVLVALSAAWCAPRLAARMGRLGRVASPIAGIFVVLLAALVAFSAAALAGLR